MILKIMKLDHFCSKFLRISKIKNIAKLGCEFLLLSRNTKLFYFFLIHSFVGKYLGCFHIIWYELGCIDVCWYPYFHFWGYVLRSRISRSYSKSNFFEQLPFYFLQKLHRFTIPPMVTKDSSISPILDIFWLFG